MKIEEYKRLHGPWHYDLAIDMLNGCVEQNKKVHDLHIQGLKLVEKRIRSIRKATHLQEKRSEFVDKAALSQRELEDSRKVRNDLRNARPFLVGPATLDALIERKPDSWNYVDNGQMPFDNLFFDLVEPISSGVPFMNLKGDLIGLHLNKRDISLKPGQEIDEERIEARSLPYNLIFYLDTEGERKKNRIIAQNIVFQSFKLKDNEQRQFYVAGQLGTPAWEDSPTKIYFSYNPVTEKVLWGDISGDENTLQRGKSIGLDFESNAKDVPNNEFLKKLPQLCVNLVNYINSHNVRVIDRKRHPRKVRFEDRFMEEPSSRNPFHLITVRSGEVEEVKSGLDKSYELDVREAVRGHDRHYRNEDGSIRLVTWIEPFIRGPEGAPWRETRYEVNHQLLGEKILREREMRHSLGIDNE